MTNDVEVLPCSAETMDQLWREAAIRQLRIALQQPHDIETHNRLAARLNDLLAEDEIEFEM